MSDQPIWRRWGQSRGGLVACVVCAFIWGAMFIQEGHNWGGDFALYISQALALLGGQTDQLYELNRLSMDRSNLNLGPYLYPHGFPALLSPVLALAGMSFPLMKAYCLLFFVGALPLFYLVCRSMLRTPGPSLMLVGVVGGNYFYLSFADNVLSDFPFLFFSLACLVLIARERANSWGAAVLLALSLFAAHSIRGVGAVLLPALMVHQVQLMRREQPTRRAWPLLAAPHLIFLLFKVAQDLSLPDGAENHYRYLEHISLGSFAENVVYYLKLIGVFFMPLQDMGSASVLVVAGGFLAVVLVGVISSFRAGTNLHLATYLGLFLLVQVAWPVRQGVRFLLPVMPLLLLYFASGVVAILGAKRQRLLGPVVALLLACVLGQSVYITHRLYGRTTNQAYTAEMRRIYAFIREGTPRGALFSFSKPRVLRLFSDRNAVRLSEAQAAANGAVSHVLVKARACPLEDSHRVVLKTKRYCLLERRPMR